MVNVIVYYEHVEDRLAPIWMVIRGPEVHDRHTPLYLRVDAPFERMMAEDFSEDSLGVSVHLSDILRTADTKDLLGINMPAVYRRIESQLGTDIDVDQLVLQFGDIEEVLLMNCCRKFIWEERKTYGQH